MVSLFLGYLVALLAVVLTFIAVGYNVSIIIQIALEEGDEMVNKAVKPFVILSVLEVLGLWFGAVQLIQAL